jgi:hypothetical protein
VRAFLIIAFAACTSSAKPAAPDAPGGDVVYDTNQRVYWLANANLAGDATIRTALGAATLPINPDGTMDYPTAVQWVAAINNHSYLGHADWQLPTAPPTDSTCAVATGASGNSFGPSCTNSALGNLFSVALGRTYPDSVGPPLATTIGAIHDVQPALYLTSEESGGSVKTFAFTTSLHGSNTTKYNYFHVLLMSPGAIGTAPTGTGVVAYSSGPAAGKAVYDTQTMTTWLLDANLAASESFGVSGSVQAGALTVPAIDPSGTMLASTAATWLAGANTASYAGATTWTLPALIDLATLASDLALVPGDPRLEAQGDTGGFHDLQPFFYWACERAQNGMTASPCDGSNPGTSPDGTTPMQWSFDFDLGFQGTDEQTKQFFVMLYYPA